MNQDVRSTVEPGFIHRHLKVPQLEREDPVALAERIDQSTPVSADFVMMMTLASVLGSLGLMQVATAVVRGNLKRFRDASIATGMGGGMGLAVSHAAVGMTNKMIVRNLGVSPSRVSALSSSAMKKLGVQTRAQLVKCVRDFDALLPR